MSNTGIKKIATLCILKHQNSILLLKRFNEPNKGLYTPIGGKVDPFESPLNAAIRETWEEVGVNIQTMDFCGIITETSPNEYNWVSYVYLAEMDNFNPPPCDEGVLEWVNFDQLKNIPMPPSDIFIYNYLLADKKFILNAEYDLNLQLMRLTDDLSGDRLI